MYALLQINMAENLNFPTTFSEHGVSNSEKESVPRYKALILCHTTKKCIIRYGRFRAAVFWSKVRLTNDTYMSPTATG